MNQGYGAQFERDCDTALGWIARFRGDRVSNADREAFALWLAEDAAHGRAMDSMQELWDDLGSLEHLPDPLADNAPQQPRRRHWLGAGLALAASLLAAVVLAPRLDGPAPQNYQTAVGERRTISLPDASELTLNTDTRLQVVFSDELRQVTLQRGEAYFEVSPDASRPFQVDAGATRVTVLGTAFNVLRRDDTHTDITVAEGVVRVSELEAPTSRAPDSEVLYPGEQLQASTEGFKPAHRIDIAPKLAWRQGELLARQMPLSELAREMQRYQDTRILISDRQIAALTVSGVFALDHPDTIIEALQRSLPVQAERLDDHTIQLLPAVQ